MKSISRYFVFSTIIPAIFLSGCAAQNQPSPIATKQAEASIALDNALKNATIRIGNSLSTLSNIEAAAHPVAVEPPAPKTGPLSQRASLYWEGNLNTAVHHIAHFLGWKVRVEGTPPIDPVMVSLNAKNWTIYRIIDQLGHQTGPGVQIIADGAANTLIIHYATPNNGAINE